MQCPVCKLDMVIVEIGDVELDTCIEGHGLWFDADELRQLFEAAGAPNLLSDLEERLDALPHTRAQPARPCPRCRKKMEHVHVPGEDEVIVLDRCPHRDGLWFDEGELAQILRGHLSDDDTALARVRAHLGHFLLSENEDTEAQ